MDVIGVMFVTFCGKASVFILSEMDSWNFMMAKIIHLYKSKKKSSFFDIIFYNHTA